MRKCLNLVAAALGLLLLNVKSSAQTSPDHDAAVASQTKPRGEELRMADVPFTEATKLTVERRGQIVLIGINRPYIQNRIDPETFQALAKAYYDYDYFVIFF